MKLARQMIAVLVLAAWAAAPVQSDARPRGAKPTANAARHVGQQPANTRGNRRPPLDRALTRRNAVGAAIPPVAIGPPSAAPVVIPGTGRAGGVRANAIGARPATAGWLPPPAGVRPVAPAVLAHGGGISGTGIARSGTAPGVIGGPAKLAGGITGTGMKPKR